VLATIGAIGAWLVYEHYSQGLPDYYQLAAMTRRHHPHLCRRWQAAREYAIENRVFVPIKVIRARHQRLPRGEDKSFYSHAGIDIPGC